MAVRFKRLAAPVAVALLGVLSFFFLRSFLERAGRSLDLTGLGMLAAAIFLLTVLYYYLRLTHGRDTPPRYVTTFSNLRGGVRATFQVYWELVVVGVGAVVAVFQIAGWSLQGLLAIDPVVIGQIGIVGAIFGVLSGLVSETVAAVAIVVILLFVVLKFDRLDPR